MGNLGVKLMESISLSGQKYFVEKKKTRTGYCFIYVQLWFSANVCLGGGSFVVQFIKKHWILESNNYEVNAD